MAGSSASRGVVPYPRWITASLAAVIGTVSAWLSVVTAYRLVFDYLILPHVKDAYVYPEWRYRAFDVVLVAWLADGLIAVFLLFSSVIRQENVTKVGRRLTVLYFVGLVVLVTAGALGVWLRKQGV